MKGKKAAVKGPSRLRRYLLLELPAWLLVGVSVAYAIATGGSGVFFQASLLVAALAWLAGGRVPSFTWGSLLLGWAVGTMTVFNLVIGDFEGFPIGALLLPVTAYLVVVLVLLQMGGTVRSRVTAGAGALVAGASQLVVFVFFHT